MTALGLPKTPSGALKIDVSRGLRDCPGFASVNEVSMSGWPPAWVVESELLKDSIDSVAKAGPRRTRCEAAPTATENRLCSDLTLHLPLPDRRVVLRLAWPVPFGGRSDDLSGLTLAAWALRRLAHGCHSSPRSSRWCEGAGRLATGAMALVGGPARGRAGDVREAAVRPRVVDLGERAVLVLRNQGVAGEEVGVGAVGADRPAGVESKGLDAGRDQLDACRPSHS